MRFTIVALIAGVGLVSAQSISTQCKNAFQSVLAAPDATCLNPSGIVSIALQSSNASIIDPVNTWLVGLCSQGLCSNSTIAAVTVNITTGCSAELASLGFTTSDPSALVTTVQAAYPTVRQIVCLKDTSANELCVTETLTDIQNSNGTLTLNSFVQFITGLVDGTGNLPKDAACSDCSKESYNIFKQNFPALVSSDTTNNLSSECGSSFIDSSSPSDITQTASTATTSASVRKSGAAPLSSVNTLVVGAVSVLVVISSAFVVLA